MESPFIRVSSSNLAQQNNALRLICDAFANKITELEDEINSLKIKRGEAETISESKVLPTITVDAATVVESEFSGIDWMNSEDKDVLESFARDNGLEIDKRKSVANIKRDIAIFLGIAE